MLIRTATIQSYQAFHGYCAEPCWKAEHSLLQSDYLPRRCVGGPNTNRSLHFVFSPMQRRTKDLKTTALSSGIRGFGPASSCRRRWIPSISSRGANKFGRKSDHRMYYSSAVRKKTSLLRWKLLWMLLVTVIFQCL